MKFKGLELKNGSEFENELCIGVQLSKESNMENLIDLIKEDAVMIELGIWMEDVMDDYLLVRNNNITFDQSGIDLLKLMYDRVIFITPSDTVLVDAHLNEFIEFEDGETYNNFEGIWGEFIENLEV